MYFYTEINKKIERNSIKNFSLEFKNILKMFTNIINC